MGMVAANASFSPSIRAHPSCRRAAWFSLSHLPHRPASHVGHVGAIPSVEDARVHGEREALLGGILEVVQGLEAGDLEPSAREA